MLIEQQPTSRLLNAFSNLSLELFYPVLLSRQLLSEEGLSDSFISAMEQDQTASPQITDPEAAKARLHEPDLKSTMEANGPLPQILMLLLTTCSMNCKRIAAIPLAQ